MENITFIVGGVFFIFILVILFRNILGKKKRDRIVFAIKKITKCKDNDCIAGYEIQGVDKSFKTFEEAKQYALFLKHGRR